MTQADLTTFFRESSPGSLSIAEEPVIEGMRRMVVIALDGVTKMDAQFPEPDPEDDPED
jgi:hypothetical protein